MPAFNARHAWLLASLLFAPMSHAAGFDCAKASGPVEKTLCADPYTCALDEKLSALWRTTLAKVADPKALRADQRAWLKNRDLCGETLGCLRRQYLMRLTELEYAAKPFSWNAVWQRIPEGVSSGAELNTSLRDDSHVAFTVEATAGANEGSLEGTAARRASGADYAEGGCALSFTAINGVLDVAQQGDDADCGAGMGVFYAGRYVASPTPLALDYDLLALGLVRTQQEDDTLRTLLKGDYKALAQSAGTMVIGDPSADVPGSEVDELWVRGLGNVNAAIVMRAADNRFWIALLVPDAQGESRARYYTNVPDWKDRLPAAVQVWYERMQGGRTLPLDRMP
ncbi:hypothetical protein KVG96_07665 [Pseudomonas sp. COR58]|uniref:Lysozyme inhibitor LprI N-terminal domain-containing protein n=1 Tax=Pseudomonas ekonensis TaxID=2842353 RepID=A0ABS6PBH3_9PSED|nr:hypothetical protein [Pseudomonas ekonensis]MBV4457816.1 hypothetical protein [Pseudomonas ekonensis]